jgi:hypothetical protein
MRNLKTILFSTTQIVMLCGVMMSFSVSSFAQNHNPAFDVSNLSIQSGSNYILIGEDDSAPFDPRTEVTLRFRNPPEEDDYNGSTTLQWSSNTSGSLNFSALAFDAEDSMTGFKDEDPSQGQGNTGGRWTWTGDNQQYYDGSIYFQGSASGDAGATATLEAYHSDDENGKFTKEFTLLKVDLEVNDTPGTNDDIVRKSIQIDDQNYRQWVPCKLKIDSSMVSALAPFIVSSAGSGVEFYKVPAGGEDPDNDTTPTSDITLVASDFSNDFAEFFVCGGGSASNSIGDIDINVTLDSASTPIFSKALTVYEFSNELLETVPGSPYSLLQNPANPSEYRLTSSLATWLIASSDIEPVGLDHSAPQLSNHQLSFSQVGRAVVIRILGNPQLIPGSQPPSLASGHYSSVIPDELKWEQVVSEFINDTRRRPVSC